MDRKHPVFRDIIFTAAVLIASFLISMVLHYVFKVYEHIPTMFVCAVFLISMRTGGYVYGIAASFVSVLAVNYAFTFPYFAFNFSIPGNLISALVMVVISVLTSTLITKLKLHEKRVAEGERERLRANLLRGISHDLRTPLTTIFGSASTLLENGETLTPAQRDRILHGIMDDSEWLMRMVENLLSVTRIGSGSVKIAKVYTVLEELLDSALVKFRKRHPDRQVELLIPDDILLIPMDPMLIEQVLLNLLENAVLHARGMTRLQLKVREERNRAIFEVEDDGCGIVPDLIGKIVKGSYIGSLSADSQKGSTGIGLSVCAAIIRAHGGEIYAENVPGGGARFGFTLGLEEEDEQ